MLLFIFFLITKMKTKSFECPKSIKNYEKNKIEGTPILKLAMVKRL